MKSYADGNSFVLPFVTCRVQFTLHVADESRRFSIADFRMIALGALSGFVLVQILLLVSICKVWRDVAQL